MDVFYFVFVFVFFFCFVCVMQPWRKGYLLGSPVCDVFMCICHFPIWYPGSGVVLDCIHS